MSDTQKCAICGRAEKLTRHNFIPRARHHNKRNKREFDRATVRRIIGLCRSCHSQIHQLFSEKELEREFNTIEKLCTHSEVAKFAKWIRARPSGFRATTSKAMRLRR